MLLCRISFKDINFKVKNLVYLSYCTQTMKYLNVAEKNDAAKNIAFHLSHGTSRRREGLSQYNKIYEFDAEVNNQKCQMVMTSVSGHLLGLEFVGAFKNWQTCNPLSLFEAPVYKYCPENYEKIKKTLEREVKSCQGLIIWTDCDREGENIGFEIIQVCRAVKNNLKVFRAKFSEITAVSVRRALHNLEQPNENISNAVDVRQELDLRIGAAFTRFQTLRLQKVFPSKLSDNLVSYGSCQFPTLGFVVERYRAIENFIPEQFWKIKVNHKINNLNVDFSWDMGRLFDEHVCRVIFDTCLESSTAEVTEVKSKPKSKWRPLPLDTIEMEKTVSRKLKINAKETMRIAEKLYTQGLISYPRTETNEFPKEMNLAHLVGLQTADNQWGAFAQGILDSGGPTPRQGKKSDKAHPPIHPTKYANNLSGNEQRLYEFIVRSFLACCSKDAQGHETTVTIRVAEETFSASGLMILARNYLDVYPYDKWSAKEIHAYQVGEHFQPTSVEMLDSSTTPPNLLTEADLIALMEKHGIGTDATHAEHIETIKKRSYVALSDAIHFVPGLLGMGLVEGYDTMGINISKPHLRAQLEADLKDICEGRKQPQQVLGEQIAKYKEVFVKVTSEANKIDQALAVRFREQPNEYTPDVSNASETMPSVLKCPKCGADMVLKQRKNNTDEYYITCLSYPNCKNAVWLPSIVKKVEVLPETCRECGPNYKKIKLEWKNNSLNHLCPPPFVVCIGGCDTMFLDLMKIKLSNVRRTSQPRTDVSNSHCAPGSWNTNEGQAPNSRTAEVHTNQSRSSTNQPRPTDQTRPVLGFVRPNQTQSVPANSRSGDVSSSLRSPPSRGPDNDENVVCRCNKAAILLTTRKQNANFGKKFYRCQVGKENGGCDFFLWAPESVQNQYAQDSSVVNQSDSPQPVSFPQQDSNIRGRETTNNPFRHSGDGDSITCNCGLPCKKITTQKEGINKGRQFYGCSKDFSSRCNFFQWADTPNQGTAHTDAGGDGWRGRRGGAGRRGGGGGGEGRRCGLCRAFGHTRTRCPNNRDQ